MENPKFRPSAKIIHTIGDHIIKDVYAAVAELVKNSYDADAKKVFVEFRDFVDPTKAKIIIRDDGCGMSRENVLNRWLIPGTNNKAETRKSLNGREMQGRKGIGRFAASILGNEFILKTTDSEKNTTIIQLDWKEFNSKKFLDEIDIDIKTETIGRPQGTEIIIKPNEKVENWNKETIERLIEELRKMISPVKTKNEGFSVVLKCNNIGFEEFENYNYQMEAIPVLDYFDYRLYGTADEMGNVDLTFINGIEKGLPPKKIFFRSAILNGSLQAPIKIDFRVFDRDPESIESLISRGSLGIDKRKTKKLLDKLCGISIFRGGFRIRPYGDPGYDWLELDKKRVQDPSRFVGSNQIVGMIEIEEEEESKLFEKSARDGLKENQHYNTLRKILLQIIKDYLSELRYDYRSRTGRGRKPKNITKELEEVFDLGKIKNVLKVEFKEENISQEAMVKIEEIIETEEREKAKSLEEIKEVIAMYQGQVTVGKIISVLMHEGRKPLKFLNEESSLISAWADQLKEGYTPELLQKISDRLSMTKEQAKLLIRLFDMLNPLSVQRRGNRKSNNLFKTTNQVKSLFEGELQLNKISCKIEIGEELSFYGWETDLTMALTNLFDNSIYWLSHQKGERDIIITANNENGKILLEFNDNGPSITRDHIERELIFEPGFSTKPEGTGLGLAIAGEAIERNNGKLKAIFNDSGAHFRIELPIGES
jgi:nitrogen-specific signal transduction histidine kinase